MGNRVLEPISDHHVGQRHLDRLVMLSDGVFAIAITLSAIEIKPEIKVGQSLWDAWKFPLMVYFMSFLLIGGVWAIHRRIVAHLRDVDGTATALNLLLLSLVALMPVVIRVSFASAESGSAALGSASMVIYALSVAANYACLAAFWFYAALVAGLAPDVDRRLAWGWLYGKLFIVAIFIALTLYALQLRVLAVICTLLALALRFISTRMEKSAKKDAPAPEAAPPAG